MSANSTVNHLELQALYQISQLVGSAMDISRTLNETLRILHETLRMERATLVLQDQELGNLSIVASYGLSPAEIKRGIYRPNEGVIGRIFQSAFPFVVPDVHAEPLFLNRTGARARLPKGEISFIGVPVVAEERPVGVLSVDRLFDLEVSFEEDIRFLTVVATLIGQFLKLHRALNFSQQSLREENLQLKEELRGRFNRYNIIGQCKRIQEVYQYIGKVAPSRATALLLGESGTGKELVARAIHENGPRKQRPFIKINCAALPENLLESELLGHEKGAFTGATEQKKGRFELADGGTLFLDEIGELPLPLQAKLLRVLQERMFERLGGSKTIQVDVRIIAATNRSLEERVVSGEFRADLYYRLNVVPVVLPPLRERKEDIPLLVDFFLKQSIRDNQKQVKLSGAVMARLREYLWPGNVRELQNVVERLVVMADGPEVKPDELPNYLEAEATSFENGENHLSMGFNPQPRQPPTTPRAEGPFNNRTSTPTPSPPGHSPGSTAPIRSFVEMEREQLLNALQRHAWIQVRVARELGLTPRQIGYRMKKHGIVPPPL